MARPAPAEARAGLLESWLAAETIRVWIRWAAMTEIGRDSTREAYSPTSSTWPPYHSALLRGNVGRHRSNRISERRKLAERAAQARVRPLQVDLAEHRVRRKQVVGGLINEYRMLPDSAVPGNGKWQLTATSV
jgi:hypothetical protein